MHLAAAGRASFRGLQNFGVAIQLGHDHNNAAAVLCSTYVDRLSKSTESTRQEEQACEPRLRRSLRGRVLVSIQ